MCECARVRCNFSFRFCSRDFCSVCECVCVRVPRPIVICEQQAHRAAFNLNTAYQRNDCVSREHFWTKRIESKERKKSNVIVVFVHNRLALRSTTHLFIVECGCGGGRWQSSRAHTCEPLKRVAVRASSRQTVLAQNDAIRYPTTHYHFAACFLLRFVSANTENNTFSGLSAQKIVGRRIRWSLYSWRSKVYPTLNLRCTADSHANRLVFVLLLVPYPFARCRRYFSFAILPNEGFVGWAPMHCAAHTMHTRCPNLDKRVCSPSLSPLTVCVQRCTNSNVVVMLCMRMNHLANGKTEFFFVKIERKCSITFVALTLLRFVRVSHICAVPTNQRCHLKEDAAAHT